MTRTLEQKTRASEGHYGALKQLLRLRVGSLASPARVNKTPADRLKLPPPSLLLFASPSPPALLSSQLGLNFAVLEPMMSSSMCGCVRGALKRRG
ncbi:hypothetical protein L596_028607 [Steinernema carpocapsae]|uniref:Uncharacterized protein n=1 Tax=Steinernema carpocapsae TaxID=34508 RepID=A0A4U5LYW8_STECR|nr:hypothetical protein L596_028607 [Steinernema carpocapsae]